jgi:hypothetical protein
MTDLPNDRNAVVTEALKIINYARNQGETDLRQIRDWVSCLATQSADDLIKELDED